MKTTSIVLIAGKWVAVTTGAARLMEARGFQVRYGRNDRGEFIGR